MVLLWLPLLSVFCLGCSGTIEKQPVVVEPERVGEDTDVHVPGIPALAYRLKRVLIGESHFWWGLEQRSTVFFAQIHQESRWEPDAKSKYASGLAQFTPDTAKWISDLYPADLGENNPLDERWAIRSLVKYDLWLFEKCPFAHDLDSRWRFLLSGYNGGIGWVSKDRTLAGENGKMMDRWTCNVEHFSKRATWAFDENRDYVKKILDRWFLLYEKGGF